MRSIRLTFQLSTSCRAYTLVERWILREGKPVCTRIQHLHPLTLVSWRRYFWMVVSPAHYHDRPVFNNLLLPQVRSYLLLGMVRFMSIFVHEFLIISRIPQYPFPLLTAISIICLIDNGRHTFVRNLFGSGSSNEGIGLFAFSTSWTLITQGSPLVWPLQTRMLHSDAYQIWSS